MFSPASTPASIRHNHDPDNDINFFGTNIGLVQDFSSESATGSDEEEEEESGAVRDAAYVFSLEQENDSLKQINLDLREVCQLLLSCVLCSCQALCMSTSTSAVTASCAITVCTGHVGLQAFVHAD